MTVPYCLCVPARNEAERLPRLLESLALQDVFGPVPIALCINNSDDGSADVASRFVAKFHDRLVLSIENTSFAPEEAHAGTARKRAMDAGLARLGDEINGVLLTTDADCRPPSHWISANLAAMSAGVDIVGGRIVIDEAEPLTPPVAAARARWDRYWEAVREIEDVIDPRSWDPAPRHGDHTGASLAIRAGLFRAAGGVPAIPLGEDRALVEAAIAAGGRLAHPITVWTRVSPRVEGRAAGGMAAAMRQLQSEATNGTPIFVPALVHWRARASWRRLTRDQAGDRRVVLEEPRLPAMPCDQLLDAIA